MYPGLQYYRHYLQMSSKERKRNEKCASVYAATEMNNPGNYGSVNCLHYYKCIFLHVPKTAGLSVSQTLFGSNGPSHMNYDWFVQNFGVQTTAAYYKFTFVRNPWDRLFSAYNFLKKGGINEDNVQFAASYLGHVNSFEQFVLEWCNEESIFSYWHFIPQYTFITSANEITRIKSDFTGRFETMEADFTLLCRKLGIKNKRLLKVNVVNTEAEKYKRFYTSEMKDKVYRLYQHDVDLLGYDF